jgi:hypothetical protein
MHIGCQHKSGQVQDFRALEFSLWLSCKLCLHKLEALILGQGADCDLGNRAILRSDLMEQWSKPRQEKEP